MPKFEVKAAVRDELVGEVKARRKQLSEGSVASMEAATAIPLYVADLVGFESPLADAVVDEFRQMDEEFKSRVGVFLEKIEKML